MTKLEIYKHYKTLLVAEAHILTGSYVLNLQGLVKREPTDLDIILVNPTQEAIDTLKRLQESTNPDFKHYDGQMYQIKHENIKIDFFINDSRKEKTLKLEDGVEISLVMPIIEEKKSYNRDKDIMDLATIARNIFNNSDLSNYLNKRK